MRLFPKKFYKGNALQKSFRAGKFKWSAILFACLGLLFSLGAFHIINQTQRIIENERAQLTDENEIFFEEIPHESHFNQYVSFIQNTKNVRFIEKFQDNYFAATDAGLLELAQNGKLLKHYTVLDGLPESDLTGLAVYNSRLFIGTRESGLIVFDGEHFSSYRFKNHETQAITDLFSDNRKLLIGTFAGGLIEFNGKKFHEIKAGKDKKRIVGINRINQADTNIFIGTHADGLWIFSNGIWKQFTTADGLLSNRIIGVEIVSDYLYAAADLGVSRASKTDLTKETAQKIFQISIGAPMLSGIAKNNERIFLTKDNGETFTFNGNSSRFNSASFEEISWQKPENLKNSRLFSFDQKILFVGTEGIWQASAENSARIFPSPFGDLSEPLMPTTNVISALAFDRNSRLWIGNFRRGIDIFSGEGEQITHLENDVIKEINFLGIRENSIVGATSKGAVSFDANLKSIVLTKENGLPGNSIMHISTDDSGGNARKIYATSKGVWLEEKGVLRGFSTVNVLPSNTVSTTLLTENSIFVGTLGGLAKIEHGKVTKVYKDSNSPLQNNWITTLCSANSRIFLGTYGGGIYELLPSGELRNFNLKGGKIFVNPNAAFTDGKRLFFGTLDGAWILDLESQKWFQLKDELPSKLVLSIGGNSENVFFGTTNGIAKINKKYWDEFENENK